MRSHRPAEGQVRSRRSTGCPVSSAMSSKSLSRCSTVSSASSAVAAISRSGMDGARCCPRSASADWTSTERSSILGVRYSTGSDASGGSAKRVRWSAADRAENPTSSRVTSKTYGKNRTPRSAARWRRPMADLSMTQVVVTTTRRTSPSDHRDQRRAARTSRTRRR